MGNILQSLKTTANKRQKHQTPTIRRRNKLLDTIHQQIESAKARQEGRYFTIQRQRRIKNKVTGESVDIVKDTKVRESWWIADDGKVCLEIRYGYKPLEISKGKTTIEVGEMSELIPILEKVRMAVQMGELDNQLGDAYQRLAEQLKVGRK